MMNKSKFIPLSMLSSFGVRCCFYPLTLIKTQLQVQFKNDVYNGLFDAACKIYKNEGASGLYKGFWISSVQIFSGVFYISTYEGVRHLMTQYGSGDRAKALVAGGCASMVGQTLIVPFDVISQHAMVLGMGGAKASKSLQINPLQIATNQSRMRIAIDIAAAILKKDGIKGYYRGYTASLMAYVPNSALWWTFYHLYQGKLLLLLLLLFFSHSPLVFFQSIWFAIESKVAITLSNQINFLSLQIIYLVFYLQMYHIYLFNAWRVAWEDSHQPSSLIRWTSFALGYRYQMSWKSMTHHLHTPSHKFQTLSQFQCNSIHHKKNRLPFRSRFNALTQFD